MAKAPLEFRSQLLPGILGLYAAADGDVAALIQRYRLPLDAAQQREVLLPLEDWHAISDEVAKQVGDPAIGVRLAELVPRGGYGILEFTARSALDFRGALNAIIRYSSLLNSLVVFNVETRGDVALLHQHMPANRMCNGRVGNEFAMALITRFVREVLDRPFQPRRVWFAHPQAADPTELTKYFGTDDIAFDKGENGIEFDAALLDAKIPTADPQLLAALEEQARQVVSSRPTANDLAGQVRRHLREILAQGEPSIADVAKRMAISSRTLQRRLSEQKTKFAEQLDLERAELARQYAKDPKLALGEIAYLLGYSELSAFTRAFRRWTGSSPAKWRKGTSG